MKNRAAGDRRDRLRFEVFGSFWGSLDVRTAVRVLNLTSHGALIAVQQPLAVESRQSICLTMDGQPTIAEVCVRHSRPAPPDTSAGYLVGVEFHAASSAFHEAIERLIAYRSSPGEHA